MSDESSFLLSSSYTTAFTNETVGKFILSFKAAKLSIEVHSECVNRFLICLLFFGLFNDSKSFSELVCFISLTSFDDDDMELDDVSLGRLNKKNFNGEVDFLAMVVILGESARDRLNSSFSSSLKTRRDVFTSPFFIKYKEILNSRFL